MGKLASVVNTPKMINTFKAKYNIPDDVHFEHCEVGEHLLKKRFGTVAIPMIAFIEGEMKIPMDKGMKNFLLVLESALTSAFPTFLG